METLGIVYYTLFRGTLQWLVLIRYDLVQNWNSRFHNADQGWFLFQTLPSSHSKNHKPLSKNNSWTDHLAKSLKSLDQSFCPVSNSKSNQQEHALVEELGFWLETRVHKIRFLWLRREIRVVHTYSPSKGISSILVGIPPRKRDINKKTSTKL